MSSSRSRRRDAPSGTGRRGAKTAPPRSRLRGCLRAAILWPSFALLLVALYLGIEYLLLPDVAKLSTENPELTAFMRIRNREALKAGRTPELRHTFVPLSRIDDDLEHAVLVAEDDAFYDHPGYDEKQIRKSIELNWEKRKVVRGASTITQQLAKNLFLSPSRNPVRKLKELVLTLRLEESLPKKRILELYLNVIEWGVDVFGAEAASRAYFGKSCTSLAPEEAATLAAVIPNPRARDPRLHLRVVEKRKVHILALMRRRGYLTAAEMAGAKSRPVATLRKPAGKPQGEKR